jgi:hypothetical protein
MAGILGMTGTRGKRRDEIQSLHERTKPEARAKTSVTLSQVSLRSVVTVNLMMRFLPERRCEHHLQFVRYAHGSRNGPHRIVTAKCKILAASSSFSLSSWERVRVRA